MDSSTMTCQPASTSPHLGSPTPAPSACPSDCAVEPAASVLETRLVGFAILSAKHWQRLEDGELFATTSRLEWAVLRSRTHGIDALRGP